MHKRLRAKGFTLVELLVVISVIVLLSTIAIIAYTVVLKQSHDSKRQSDMTALAHALEIYYQKNGEYPAGCILAGTCKTYTDSNAGDLNNDPGSFTSANSTQINGSTTLDQLEDILPGLSDSFGDPLNDSESQVFINNQSTATQHKYIYIGGLQNTSSSAENLNVDFNGNGSNKNPMTCQIWVENLQPSSVSSYIIGYYSEQDSLWHLRQGNHGTKFKAGDGGDGGKKLFCWGGQAAAIWSD